MRSSERARVKSALQLIGEVADEVEKRRENKDVVNTNNKGLFLREDEECSILWQSKTTLEEIFDIGTGWYDKPFRK